MPRAKIELRDLVRTDRHLRALELRGTAAQVGPTLVCYPCRVATAHPGEDGFVVAADGLLVAVLVHVGAERRAGAEDAGPSGWHLEVGFGPCQAGMLPLFETLGEALAWLRRRLGTA